jgi:transcriptional regulator with XRE-family HTH domain
MAERRVPAWYLAVGIDVPTERIYGVFRDLLQNLPMSSSELARGIGVSQPAVSRWSHGVARPSLEEMALTLDAVEARMASIRERVDRARLVIQLVEEAVVAYDVRRSPVDEPGATGNPPAHFPPSELLEIRRRLQQALQMEARARPGKASDSASVD